MKGSKQEFGGLSVQECLGMYLSHIADRTHHGRPSSDRPFRQRILDKLTIDDYQLCEHVAAIIMYIMRDSKLLHHDSKLYRKVTEPLGDHNPCIACGAFYKAVESVSQVNYSPSDDISYFVNHPSAEPLLIAQLKHSLSKGKLIGKKLDKDQKVRLKGVYKLYNKIKGNHSGRWSSKEARHSLPEEFDTLIEHRPQSRKELDTLVRDPRVSLLSIDVSKIDDMSGLFEGCTNRRDYTGIEFWDVSGVRDMSGMFDGAEYFNQPLNNWDVSGVKDMSSMFSNTRFFNQPLNRWEVSAVEDMSNMFLDAREFNQPLDSWDVSGVLFLSDMFSGAESFNQSLEVWDPVMAADMSNMFDNSGVSLIPSWFKKE